MMNIHADHYPRECRLRRRARSFSDVVGTCFHGQRVGDAIAGEEKDHARDLSEKRDG
jgi:hypothetical protein